MTARRQGLAGQEAARRAGRADDDHRARPTAIAPAALWWARARRQVTRLRALAVFVFLMACVIHPVHAQVVSEDFFGLVVNRAEQPGQAPPEWPGVRFGAWRLWDSYTNWPHLEPQPGRWQFEQLDRRVEEAQQRGVKLLLVLAHSPGWASSDPGAPGAYGRGVTAPPARIADWENYIRTVALRYRGRLREYQVWNEPSDASHWSGDVAGLVALTCAAHRVLKAVDPSIKVVSPASNGGGRHLQYLQQFLAAGGAACVDVIAHHLYVFRYGPEAIVDVLRAVRATMQRQGVGHLPLWITEIGWWIARTDGKPEVPSVARGGWRQVPVGDELGAYLQRTFTLARAEGADRVYWYAWKNDAFGLADERGRAKPGVSEGWARSVETLLGRTAPTCSTARPGEWSCLVKPAPGAGARTLRWTDPTALVAREGPASEPDAAAAARGRVRVD